MPLELHTVIIKKAELLDAMSCLTAGATVRLARIPAGATILTSNEMLSEQLIFNETIEISYSLETDPPPTVEVIIGNLEPPIE